MSQTRRSGFTLMELLAVMLLIITVLSMGVPAMFAAERKAYVNEAMNELIRINRICMALQRELAARGDDGVITLTIQNPTTTPTVNVTCSTGLINPADKLGKTLPISINADEFISRIDSSSVTAWSYAKQTGFIDSPTPITLTFKALPSGAIYKVSRDLILYPQGYSDIP